MFGLFYYIAVGLGLSLEKASDYKFSQEDRERARKKGQETYLDNRGRRRLVSTNERVHETTLSNGDRVLKYYNKKDIIHNYSDEKYKKGMEKNKREALQKGKSTYCITVCGVPRADHTEVFYRNDNGYVRNPEEIRGYRFKDFKTGNIYVIRKVKGRYYFMDITNGHLVRETDYQKEETAKYDKYDLNIHPGVNITEFNKKKDRYKKENYEYVSFESRLIYGDVLESMECSSGGKDGWAY